jgi:hypothetical protein
VTGWLTALSVLTLLLMARLLQSPKRLFEFPYFIAFTFGTILLPQALSLSLSNAVSDQQKSDLFCMCFLCILAAVLGYEIKPRRLALPAFLTRRPTENRIFWGALILLIIGSVFETLFFRLPEGTVYNTGVATIYLFFVGFIAIGFGVSFYAALKYNERRFWLLAALASITSLVQIFVYGRREPTALFLMFIAASFFFVKHRSIPRFVLALSMFLALTIVPIVGEYRSAAAEDPLHAYQSLDLSGSIKAYTEGQSHGEMMHALWVIADTKEMGDYGWGGGYWDEVIFSFVPAQIVGMDLKKSLFFGNRIVENADIAQMYARGYANGTTFTAAGDAFHELGYFGAVVFAIMGYFFRGFWEIARCSDAIYVHVAYASAAVTAMKCLTHGTADFLPGLIYVFLPIALIQLRYKREPAK